MNQEENTNSVVFNGHQETHSSGNENAEVRNHYFHQHSLMNPDTGAVVSDTAWLLSLKRRTVRFVSLKCFHFWNTPAWKKYPSFKKPAFPIFSKIRFRVKNGNGLLRRGAVGQTFCFRSTATVI